MGLMKWGGTAFHTCRVLGGPCLSVGDGPTWGWMPGDLAKKGQIPKWSEAQPSET